MRTKKEIDGIAGEMNCYTGRDRPGEQGAMLPISQIDVIIGGMYGEHGVPSSKDQG